MVTSALVAPSPLQISQSLFIHGKSLSTISVDPYEAVLVATFFLTVLDLPYLEGDAPGIQPPLTMKRRDIYDTIDTTKHNAHTQQSLGGSIQ